MTITRVGDKILVKSEDGTVWLMQAVRRVSSEEKLFNEPTLEPATFRHERNTAMGEAVREHLKPKEK